MVAPAHLAAGAADSGVCRAQPLLRRWPAGRPHPAAAGSLRPPLGVWAAGGDQSLRRGGHHPGGPEAVVRSGGSGQRGLDPALSGMPRPVAFGSDPFRAVGWSGTGGAARIHALAGLGQWRGLARPRSRPARPGGRVGGQAVCPALHRLRPAPPSFVLSGGDDAGPICAILGRVSGSRAFQCPVFRVGFTST